MRALEMLFGFWLIVISSGWVCEWAGVFDELEKMQSNVGVEVIIDNSTYTIVDYNSWNGTYTLSNGLVISELYFEMINKTEG
jgi:hypothetical protein